MKPRIATRALIANITGLPEEKRERLHLVPVWTVDLADIDTIAPTAVAIPRVGPR